MFWRALWYITSDDVPASAGDRLKGEAMLRRYGTILIVAGGACIVAVVVISLPRDIGARIVDEQGPIEQASWIGYMTVVLLAILVRRSGRLADERRVL